MRMQQSSSMRRFCRGVHISTPSTSRMRGLRPPFFLALADGVGESGISITAAAAGGGIRFGDAAAGDVFVFDRGLGLSAAGAVLSVADEGAAAAAAGVFCAGEGAAAAGGGFFFDRALGFSAADAVSIVVDEAAAGLVCSEAGGEGAAEVGGVFFTREGLGLAAAAVVVPFVVDEAAAAAA